MEGIEKLQNMHMHGTPSYMQDYKVVICSHTGRKAISYIYRANQRIR